MLNTCIYDYSDGRIIRGILQVFIQSFIQRKTEKVVFELAQCRRNLEDGSKNVNHVTRRFYVWPFHPHVIMLQLVKPRREIFILLTE